MEGQPLGEEHVQIVRRHDVVLPLVRRAGQEEAQDLERHQPRRLAARPQQFEDGAHALFGVERRHHRRRELGQQRHQQLQHVVDVVIL